MDKFLSFLILTETILSFPIHRPKIIKTTHPNQQINNNPIPSSFDINANIHMDFHANSNDNTIQVSTVDLSAIDPFEKCHKPNRNVISTFCLSNASDTKSNNSTINTPSTS